jgi:hypothetical protein
MNRLRTPAAAVLFALVILATAGYALTMEQDAQKLPETPTEAPKTVHIALNDPTPRYIPPAFADETEPFAAVSEPEPPAWDPDTHENGHCEGYCWEGICPVFAGYPEPPYTDEDVVMLAKTVWGEAQGCSPEEQRLVIWTVLQRVDADGWGNTIAAVLTAHNQFVGYRAGNPVDPDIHALCAAELSDWWHGAAPPTHELYAPTAPYFFFDGDGRHNWFRAEWRP